MRTILFDEKSGILKMILWEGTDNEHSFPIIAANSNYPHVKANGYRFPLTVEEIILLRRFQKLYR